MQTSKKALKALEDLLVLHLEATGKQKRVITGEDIEDYYFRVERQAKEAIKSLKIDLIGR